jgi:hypothetical protein
LHTFLYSIDQGNGINALTLAVTLTNTRADALYDMVLTSLPPLRRRVVDPATKSLLVASSPVAGNSVTMTWTFSSVTPGELMEPLLLFHGEGLTITSDTAVFVVPNEQEVTP